MSKLPKNLPVSIFLVSVCGIPAFAGPLTFVVNNAVPVGTVTASCPKNSFTTIQAAVNYSRAGDTVYVCAANPYAEQVVINKSITMAAQTGATIQPAAFVANTVDNHGSPLAAAVLVTSSSPVISNTTVSGFIVDGSNISSCSPEFAGIVYSDASGTIVHNAVTNIEVFPVGNGCQTGLGIYVLGSGTTTPSVTLTQNSVHDYQKGGINITGTGVNAIVQFNVVRGYGPTSAIAQNGIEFNELTTGSITGSTVSGNIYTGLDYQSTDMLIFADNLAISSNNVRDGDTGIYCAGLGATITRNAVSNTTYDGILFYSGSATLNTLVDTQQRAGGWAIEYAGTTAGTASGNTIVDAYIGVANDNGATLAITGNKYFATYFPYFDFSAAMVSANFAVHPHAKRVVNP